MLEVSDRVRRRPGPGGPGQHRGGGSVAERRRLVDVVGPRDHPHELLEGVDVLVRRTVAGDPRDGCRTVLRADCADPIGEKRERLLPGGGAEDLLQRPRPDRFTWDAIAP